jgi:hypothetical protein
LYPLPRGDHGGLEFIYMEFSGNQAVFTRYLYLYIFAILCDLIYIYIYCSLIEIQTYGQDAKPMLIVNNYTELAKTKKIVLMHGEVDGKFIKAHEAQYLANLFRTFYLDDNLKYINYVEGNIIILFNNNRI